MKRMRTKFVQGREVLDPVTSDASVDTTERIFGLTRDEMERIGKIISDNIDSSTNTSEFIGKVVEAASDGNAGWNFIMGFACGKVVEGMNTASIMSMLKKETQRMKEVIGDDRKSMESDLKNLADQLGYIG